jgi:adenine-specific DNA-methyltransferase
VSSIERIQGITPDLTKENVDKLLTLFPDVATEITNPQTGETEQAVDFDALKERLGDVAEGNRERYQFTWPGKREAKRLAREPIAKTLRPVEERSKNWDTTRNLYIEGDNLDVLKLLRENYAGKVKLIYIDPPYNTGNDFIYKDNFGKTVAADKSESGDYDDEGGQLVANPESNGRFHSDWCSMIYPRLLLARDLLTQNGAIFISIDDNESKNLKSICDEIFGASNFVDTIIWQKRYSPQNAVQWFSESHDYILVYAKNKSRWFPNLLERSNEMNARYTNRDNDPRGPWKPENSTAQGGHGTKSQFYTLTAPNGKQHNPPSGRCWLYTQPVMEKMIADNRVWFGEDGNNMPAIKRFLSEVKQGVACQTIWPYTEVGHNQEGKKELKALFPEEVPFDTPKPTRLMKRILDIASDKDSLILDFFSGSATMGEAVIQKNADDEGQRKFILVQLPEETTGQYSTLTEIGGERIRRAGEKIKAEIEAENAQLTLEGTPKKVPDIGFRVLRLDNSNYEDRHKNVGTYSQADLDLDVDITKSDRSDLDLLLEALPKFLLPYDVRIDTLSGGEFDSHTVYNVNDGQLLACFEPDIPESLTRAMAAFRPRPSYALVSERSLPDSAACTNFVEIFKQSADSKTGSTKPYVI